MSSVIILLEGSSQKLNFKIHRITFSFAILLIIFCLSGCGTENREKAMKEVNPTDLSNEHIDGIKLGTLLEENGRFEPHPDNEYYAPKRNHDQYWNERVILSVAKENGEILSISTLEGNNTDSTEKGIKVGTSIDDVIKLTEKNTTHTLTKEQTIYEIGYVDHRNNYKLSFYHFDNKVTSIDLSYAFYKLQWFH